MFDGRFETIAQICILTDSWWLRFTSEDLSFEVYQKHTW